MSSCAGRAYGLPTDSQRNQGQTAGRRQSRPEFDDRLGRSSRGGKEPSVGGAPDRRPHAARGIITFAVRLAKSCRMLPFSRPHTGRASGWEALAVARSPALPCSGMANQRPTLLWTATMMPAIWSSLRLCLTENGPTEPGVVRWYWPMGLVHQPGAGHRRGERPGDMTTTGTFFCAAFAPRKGCVWATPRAMATTTVAGTKLRDGLQTKDWRSGGRQVLKTRRGPAGPMCVKWRRGSPPP